MKNTIFSWLVNRLFKRFGKLKFFVLDKDVKFFKGDGMGGYKVCSFEETIAINYSIKAKFYNKKDIPISLDNLALVFQKGAEKVFVIPLKRYKEIKIPSWESVIFDFSSGTWEIEKNDLKDISKCNRVYFSARLPSNKKFKPLITKKSILTYLTK